MTFRVTMKDPDTLTDAIDSAVKAIRLPDLDPEEAEFVREQRAEKVGKFCSKWFSYGEYLTVEIDTEAGTCVVVPTGG